MTFKIVKAQRMKQVKKKIYRKISLNRGKVLKSEFQKKEMIDYQLSRHKKARECSVFMFKTAEIALK